MFSLRDEKNRLLKFSDLLYDYSANCIHLPCMFRVKALEGVVKVSRQSGPNVLHEMINGIIIFDRFFFFAISLHKLKIAADY